MRLPDELLEAVQREVEKTSQRDLVKASAELTSRYKAADFSSAAFDADLSRAAYLATRLPATYAAIARVLSEIHDRAPHAGITSMLDLGAGPGTAVFAAAELFPGLQRAQLVESNASWIKLGRRLAASSASPVWQNAQWIQSDLRAGLQCPPHDLVVLSYALGELPQAVAKSLVERAWSLTLKFMVVVEPGTPRGYASMLAARSLLIDSHADILAPCPNRDACPMAGTSDWCHFAQRIERTSLHRRLKGGELGYEDEKFSYVIASRTAYPPARARIVRRPRKLSGYVQLTLCEAGAIQQRTVTRSSKAAYKIARQAEWGDGWEGASSAGESQ